MYLKSLRVFCDVVGWRSFSRAADENNMSQSAASQVVQHLEDHLGVRLIDRSKRPFVLTPEGERYYAGCRKLIERYVALEEEVKTMHREISGRVRVASIYSVGLHHMNRYLQQFLTAHPKANVRLEYQHPDRVYEMIEHDLADLGLVSYPKQSRSITAHVWREEPMVLACAPTHRLAGRGTISWSDLAGEKMIGFDPGLRIRDEIDHALASHDTACPVVMEFDNIETMKRAIEIDAGVGILPEPTIQRELEAKSLAAVRFIDGGLIRPVGIIHRRGRPLSRATKAFMELLFHEAGMAMPAELADDVGTNGGNRDEGASGSGHGGEQPPPSNGVKKKRKRSKAVVQA